MNQNQVRVLCSNAIKSVYAAYFSTDNPGIQQILMLLEANLSSVYTQLNKDDLQSRDREFIVAAASMQDSILPRIKMLNESVEKLVHVENDIKLAMSDLIKLSSSVSFLQDPIDLRSIMFNGYIRWDVIAMFVLFGLMITFEMIGVFNTHMVTITQIIKDFVPMPCRIMVVSWLAWHFILSDIVKPIYPTILIK